MIEGTGTQESLSRLCTLVKTRVELVINMLAPLQIPIYLLPC